MSWHGNIKFGNAFAAYVGYSSDIKLHQHAAIQLVLSAHEQVEIVDAHGNKCSGQAFMISPMAFHSLQCCGELTLIFLEPHSTLALELIERAGSSDIVALDSGVLPFSSTASFEEITNALNSYNELRSNCLDKRLAAALEVLSESPGEYSIREVAQKCNLSESRLRALARQQIHLPLSTWLIWLKLERAVRELMIGASLSDAALRGGFADQAHFTRTVRRMFGITPKSVLSIFQ